MPRATKGRITITTIANLQPGDEVRDSELKGFGARRQATATSYFIHTRINGRLKRVTLGRHGSPWTPESARKEAARLLMSIRGGEDPAQQRDERRRTSDTFEVVAERFLTVHGRKLKPRTQEQYASLIRLQLGRSFNGKPIDDIKSVNVARAHASWGDTPRTANHALAVLSKLINWADQYGFRTPAENPCRKIERFRETKRERYLTDAELVQLGATLAQLEAEGESPWVVGVVRMLVLTGARLSEMLTLRWDYLDAERRILRLPDSKTGAKIIHLSTAALQLLRTLPRIEDNPFVFPGHIDGRHIVNLQKPWRMIRAKAGIPDVRLHDLRHSFASIAIDVGGTLPIIGRLLGHTQAQTTARYAHVAPSPAHRIADAAGARIAEAWAVPAPDETRVPEEPDADRS